MTEEEIIEIAESYKMIDLVYQRKFVMNFIRIRFIEDIKPSMQYLKGTDIIDVVNEYNILWEKFCEHSGYGNKNMFMGMIFKIFPNYINELRRTK